MVRMEWETSAACLCGWRQYVRNFTCREENTEIFLKASKAIGLVVSSENTKYMISSRQHNVVQNRNIS